MNRVGFQHLARERLVDAEVLLTAHRWSAAYYLAGYSIECALKSCVLRYIGESSALFEDRAYLRSLTDCWTHDLPRLVSIAGLDATFGSAQGQNPALASNWAKVQDWNESSRYKVIQEDEARALFQAVADVQDGVLSWFQTRW